MGQIVCPAYWFCSYWWDIATNIGWFARHYLAR
jgi:hypothetical protein